MRRQTTIALLLVVAAVLTAAADFADTESLTSASPELNRMKLAELRYHLRRRGVDECGDCVEKEHFRQRLRDALSEGAEVSRTHDEAVALAEEGKRKSQAKAKPPAAEATPEPKLSDDELENLRNMFAKKREENEKMKEALRKAGIDPSTVKTDADVFGDLLNNKGPGAGAGGKKKAKRERPPPKPTPDEAADL